MSFYCLGKYWEKNESILVFIWVIPKEKCVLFSFLEGENIDANIWIFSAMKFKIWLVKVLFCEILPLLNEEQVWSTQTLALKSKFSILHFYKFSLIHMPITEIP